MSAEAPLIHARGLVKTFGSLRAVDGVDFDAQKGEAFGFLGPNGAGKSSTMRMIGCVSPVSAGTLRIRATPVDPELASRVRVALEHLTGFHAKVGAGRVELTFADEHELAELAEALERATAKLS